MKNPIATIQMENGKTIKIELYNNVAPNTVNNFILLAEKGFYNGLIFHRVGRFSHIQTGRPEGTDNNGGLGYKIKGEFISNGYPNDLKLERAVVAMVPLSKTNISTSQFIIMVDTPPLKGGDDGTFGRVIDGMDEVDRIANVKVDENLKPIDDQKISSISIEIFGEIYGEPVKEC